MPFWPSLSNSQTQNSLDVASTTKAPSVDAVNAKLLLKQATLVSGATLKTVNGNSLLGSGNIDIAGGGGAGVQNSLTPASTTLAPSVDAVNGGLSGRALSSHSHSAAAVTDFSEAVDDRVASLLVAGANVSLTYDDTANTLTVAASGGTGGTSASPVLLSIATNLTRALHANRQIYTGAANVALTLQTDANGGFQTGDRLLITPGPGTSFTLSAASGVTITSAQGATIDPALAIGREVELVWINANLWHAVSPAVTSGGITDGDKGDVVVSSGGTVWTVESNIARILTPVPLSENTSLTAASHGNRTLLVDTAGIVLTINSDATGGWTADDSLDVVAVGAGTFTLVQGTATLTTDSGASADSTTAVGKRVQAQRIGANTWRTASTAIVTGGGGGGWGSPVAVNANVVMTRAAHANRTLIVESGYRSFTLNTDATAGWLDGDRIYIITPGTFVGFDVIAAGVTIASNGAASTNINSSSTGANALMLERVGVNSWQLTTPVSPIIQRGFAQRNSDFTFQKSHPGTRFAKTDTSTVVATIPTSATIGIDAGAPIRIANAGASGNITIARDSGVTLWDNGVNQNVVLTPGQCVEIYKAIDGGDIWFAMRG